MVALHKRVEIEIPRTSPSCYLSGYYALNLHMPEDETSGDWHFSSYYYPSNADAKVTLAGEGHEVNTNPALKNIGIRRVDSFLLLKGFVDQGVEVFAANHYRAIVDIACAFAVIYEVFPKQINNREVNAYLDTEAQIARLKRDYVKPVVDETHNKILADWYDSLEYLP